MSSYTKLVVSLVAVILLMQVSATSLIVVEADDEDDYEMDDDDDDYDDDDDDDKRQVALSEDSDRFHVISVSSGYSFNDRFDLIFEDSTLELWYTENVSSPSSPFWEMELEFEELFSFVDDGNGVFDRGDTVKSVLDISDTSYSLTYSIKPLASGGTETVITAVSGGGELTLTFTITSAPTFVNQMPITPNNVKLDIGISGFEPGDGANSIGLRISVDVDNGSSIGFEELKDSKQLNLTKSGMEGFFRWANYASVDGIQRAVGTTWGGDTLTLSYPAGDVIVHDPVLGIISGASLSGILDEIKVVGNILIYGFALALASALVFGMVAIRRRRNT